ncbi:DoxX family protein [Variovorax sp.]|uniref:DoxX family protein n=1 Tax=Variovorax sp. TaxID=1871043 RepID=UPI002D6DE0B9|nr:DoxX family protein [Variovorax sp.]HYP85303.1 DoxX family protein [Variovorax sp.]
MHATACGEAIDFRQSTTSMLHSQRSPCRTWPGIGRLVWTNRKITKMNSTKTSKLAAPSAPALWSGRVLAAVVVLILLADGGINLFVPHLVAGAMKETGFAPHLSSAIGLIAIVSAVLYAIPKTSVLGAILSTAFLGGAICAHVRLGDFVSPAQAVSLALGIASWVSLYLRSPEMRRLVPLTASSQ